MSPEQWDDLCQRCGRCCYEKVEFNDQIYLTATPCEYLDLQTRQCTVYEQRCTIKHECASLSREVIALGVLPEGCPYRSLVPDPPVPRHWKDLPADIRHQLKLVD